MRGRLRRRGRIWYTAIRWRGRLQVRTTGTTRRAEAERVLAERLEATVGHTPRAAARSWEALLDGLARDRRLTGIAGSDLAARRRHLDAAFSGCRAEELTTSALAEYAANRLAEGAAAATVNRELAVVRRALRVAEVHPLPRIRHLREAPPRRDFVTGEALERLASAMPEPYGDFVRFCFASAWRQGEVAALAWGDVDWDAGVVQARAETTKGREAHTLALSSTIAAILHRRQGERRIGCPWVFHASGVPIRTRGGTAPLRRHWRAACAAEGLSGNVLHGLRRSRIRQLVQAGVDPLSAMAISGHRSLQTLRRYAIVSPADQRRALERADAFHEEG